jgi:hypothetical protein
MGEECGTQGGVKNCLEVCGENFWRKDNAYKYARKKKGQSVTIQS